MQVAIAGYGIEGEANYRYWLAKGDDVVIVDEADVPAKPIPAGARLLLGKNSFRHLAGFDIVVRTASLPPHHIKTDGRVWSSTNEFFAECPAPIIGVTGTKGKGTVSSLIASILREAGHTVHLVGNIGLPALAALPDITADDIVVYEMSSFQLWDLQRSPHVAVVLMIEPDHLDVHSDFNDYIRAKSNIRRHQIAEDICFYHPTNSYSAKIAKSNVVGDIVRFGMKKDGGVYVEDDMFMASGEEICPVSALQLPGAHNVENACAAISAARIFTVDNYAIQRGLEAFTGLPHRLKFVRKVRGVSYYDDSIATTPGSAIAALRAFDAPKIIILGGSEKGADYSEVVDACKETGTWVIAIGETGKVIAKLCQDKGADYESVDGDMRRIVRACQSRAVAGTTVLLSPASASFGMFKSYSDRGDQFVAAVNEL